MENKVVEVVFRDVLVLLKEKIMAKENRGSVIHWINAWIQVIDEHEAAKKKAK